jgi:hypothetical protein
MMNSKTVRQILEVLALFRVKHANGDPLTVARQEAIREVARRYGVAYQTIEDACRRRLGFDEVSQFDTLLQDWVGGEYLPLMNQLTSRASSVTHTEIATFFRQHASPTERQQDVLTTGADSTPHEEVTVSVSQREARKLRAIAEIKGIDERTFFNQIVSRAIRDETRAFAQALLRDSE